MFTRLLTNRRVRVHCDRGRVSLDAGDFDLAAAHFAAAVRLDPERPAGYVGRGVARLKQWRCRGAIQDFSEALRPNPQDGFAFYCRALAYEVIGDHDRARADYASARAIDPALDAPAPVPNLSANPRFQFA